tara:strand:- start:4396 stop:4710 length:315 start_codon:yes stop_codon:yes gene_type:complete
MNKYKVMRRGGIDNPGFRSLPENVQENIKANMAYGGMQKMPGGGAVMDMLKAKAMQMGGMSPDSPESKQQALVKLAQSMSEEDAMMLKQILDQMLGENQGRGMM